VISQRFSKYSVRRGEGASTIVHELSHVFAKADELIHVKQTIQMMEKIIFFMFS